MKFIIKSKTETYHHESTGELITIGRSPDNDFVIPVEDFSRKHCTITIKGNYVFIMDLGSKNGTEVNGKKVNPQQQYPIYQNSKVILAKLFDFIISDGSNHVDEDFTNLERVEPIRRNKA